MFSARLPTLFEQAWPIASLDAKTGPVCTIRSAHLLQALLIEPELA